MPTHDDQRLFLKVATGDQEAFAELFARHAATVFGLSRWLVGSEVVAESVARRTFVDAWRAAATWDGAPADVGAWLVGIAHRLAVERNEADGGADRGPDGGWPAASQERSDAGGLTPLEASAVALTYFAGVPYVAAAARLHVTPAAVVAAVRSGLARLAPPNSPGSTAFDA